jgi:uncharacterized Rossmann fold enzyme
MTKIEELKSLTPQERAKSMRALFLKNRNFFKKNYKGFSNILKEDNTAPYLVNIDNDFMTITDTRTGELCHPQVGLDRFAESLGDWTHQAWHDLIVPKLTTHVNYGKYSQFPTRYIESIFVKFPGLFFRIQNRAINLPTLSDDERFSNSVVFFGIFHGLHIDHYLSRTQLRNAAFIEPEIPRFVVSCYFLDYQELDRRFGGLILHVGHDFPRQHIQKFFNNASVTSSVWVRILPGYAFDKIEELMREFRLAWRRGDSCVPSEWGLAGMQNTLKNINAGKKVWGGAVKLSPGSRIAVVGSGPSLTSDLPWLQKHQDQVIIFAAHSAVSALQKNGIQPDFQFNIEIRPWGQEIFDKLQLDPSIPIVTMITDEPDKFKDFDEVLMLAEDGGIYPVVFKNVIPFLSPTTGNVALALACRCSPGQVYLFGLDFGFREADKTHTDQSTTYQSAASHKTQIGSIQLEVAANFPTDIPVFSQPYFNGARHIAETAIAMAKGVKVFNCADGAKIHGATPQRAESLRQMTSRRSRRNSKPLSAASLPLSGYNKQADLVAIRAAFVPQEEGQHWLPFSVPGEERLGQFKQAIHEHLQMEQFDWLEFSEKLDTFAAAVYRLLPPTHISDRRMVPYMAVILELLEAWYVLISFTNNEEEWLGVFDLGLARLTEMIDEMEWEDPFS